jgi:PleD family two-component response regulator
LAWQHGKDLGKFSALLREADQMLYEAKCAGRNVVKVSFP